MRRTGDVLLLQSSVRHRPPAARPGDVFLGNLGATQYPLRSRRTTEVEEALVMGFAEAFGLRLVPGLVTGWEEERAATLTGRVCVGV
jgi:hypothetical protein